MDGTGERTPANSPIGSDENLSPGSTLSRFGRIRRSFRSNLKQKLQSSQQENVELRKRLENVEQEVFDIRKKLTHIVSNNTYYVGNLQIGNQCTMTTENNTDILDETVGEVECLISTLTRAIETDVKERANLSMENENTKMVSEHYQKWQERAKDDTKAFDELKTLLTDLQADRSDEELLGDCLTALKNIRRQRFVVDFKSLPVKAQPGIIRLVNKFGAMSWEDFAIQIGIEPKSIYSFSKHLGRDSSEDVPADSDRLGEDICAMVMAKWAQPEDNTTERFLQYVTKMQRKMYTDLEREYRQEVIGYTSGKRTHGSSLHRDGSTESIITVTTTRTERMHRTDSMFLDEQRKQMECVTDMLEGLPEKLALLKNMNTKVDALYNKLIVESRLTGKLGEAYE